jgi:hypothetical protein
VTYDRPTNTLTDAPTGELTGVATTAFSSALTGSDDRF